jgi:hypothetical protein
MADQQTFCTIAALRRLEACVQSHMREQLASELANDRDVQNCLAPLRLSFLFRARQLIHWPVHWSADLFAERRWLRRACYAAGSLAVLAITAMGALAWRLSSGPIDLDLATPWLTAAIEENFGSYHQIHVGGTQLERDASGRAALRMRDIVVSDPDGTIVASAPKVEVAISSAGLFAGRMHAERLSLVGAEMAVRIEPDSKVTVFAGANNKRPFATASAASIPVSLDGPPLRLPSRAEPDTTALTAVRAAAQGGSNIPDFAALLAWIDGLGASGLDGHELSELGLKNGTLTVDDQRNGKQWAFHDINLSLTRPAAGGIALALSSDSSAPPWVLRAALSHGADGHRIIDIETQKLPAKDIMLAMRLDGVYEPDIPLSGRIRAELGPDGIPQMVDGRIVAERGTIVDPDDPLASLTIDRAEFNLAWDAERRALAVPVQIVSGSNRIGLVARFEAPQEAGGDWGVELSRGDVLLASAPKDPNPLVLNRLQARLRISTDKQRIEVVQGDIGNADIGFTLTGHVDYANGDPRLVMGVTGSRMSVAALKKIWPFCVTAKVRNWVNDHIVAGTVDRMVISTNAPFSTLRASGPRIPEGGLIIEIDGHGAELRPVAGLPAIRDADLALRVNGHRSVVNLGRGNVDLSAGRKLTVSGGVFEVPDTFPPGPAAKVRFRLDGSVPAAAEVLALDRLREFSGAPLDPATSRGTMTAQATIGFALKEDQPPGSSAYTVNMDLTNFSAEHLMLGQKLEAATLHVAANNQGYWIKSDAAKLNGIATSLDYRKPRGDGDAEIRLQATLDEAARGKLGFDLASAVGGSVPVKVNGRLSALENGENRFAIEADLTQARIDGLLPGWNKAGGKAAHATFTLVSKQPATRFDDLAIDGPGISVKGAVELDENNQVQTANFPTFNLSDGDKTMLRAERGPDGALRVMMRGDVYDGRNFVKSAMAGPSDNQAKPEAKDVDLDIKLGTVVGFHGETLRGLDLTMSRRGGAIKSLAVSAKLGREAPLTADLRGRSGTRQIVYIDAKDAGAFFRFTDMYPKVYGGEIRIAMDPPTGDSTPQEGLVNIQDFSVRGEDALNRVVAGAPGGQRSGVDFSRLRVEFTRTLGRIAMREGIVSGPLIGATVDGYIDYLQDDVRLRGTFVPLYGLNNMFGQIPLFGVFLGGSKEGLVGVTYEVAGPPSAPMLRVNPISPLAPGFLRKFFEFPNGNGQTPPPSSASNGPIPPSYADTMR